jgi:hypothetical protein
MTFLPFVMCSYVDVYILELLLIPVENLPPVSTTLAKRVKKFTTGVVDTSGAP